MEKKNSNVIIREDGKQYIGYIADLEIAFADKVNRLMEEYRNRNEGDDSIERELDRTYYAFKDLAGYTDPQNVLAKVTYYEDGDYKYWYVQVI